MNGDRRGVSEWLEMCQRSMELNPRAFEQLDPSIAYDFTDLLTKITPGSPLPTIYAVADTQIQEEVPADKSREADSERQVQMDFARGMTEILSKQFSMVSIEGTVSDGGRCDIVGYERDNGPVWIIEVKLGVGDHALVGQVARYALDFESRLLYKIYSSVKTVTVCSGYTRHALTSLKRMGTTIVKYDYDKSSDSFNYQVL